MKWQILELNGENDTISNVRYKASHEGVESEGYCHFDEPKPLAEATELAVLGWVRDATMKDGQNTVEQRLQEQVDALKIQSIQLPWKPATFTVTI